VTTSDRHFRFIFAYLALCAAAVLARPSALIFSRGDLGVALRFELNGCPRFAGLV
jgi:hypothetical protein